MALVVLVVHEDRPEAVAQADALADALVADGHRVDRSDDPGFVAAGLDDATVADAPKAVATIAIKAVEVAAGFAANDRGNFCGPVTNPDCIVMFAKLFALP